MLTEHTKLFFQQSPMNDHQLMTVRPVVLRKGKKGGDIVKTNVMHAMHKLRNYIGENTRSFLQVGCSCNVYKVRNACRIKLITIPYYTHY